MPFINQNWAAIASSANIPQRNLQSGAIVGAPGLYSYQSHTETLGTIASDVTYFSPVDINLYAGDLIYIVGSDASAEFTVLSVDDDTGNVIIAQNAGSGDVVGPGSSTDNAVVRFNGTTGQIIQNSLAILNDAGALSGLTGLISSGLTYPVADAAAGSHMVTDGAGHLSLQPVGGGGDVFGPASSTDNALSRFDGTSGKLIQNSLVALSDIGALTGVTNITTLAATIGALDYATIDGPAGAHMVTDGAGNLSLVPQTGGGDVTGPASSTDNALARFDSTSGKLIQNSVGILSDAGALSGLTGLVSSGLTYPVADATAGFAITTNGSGTLALTAVGDVVGPVSSTDNHLAIYSGTSGSLIKDTSPVVLNVGAMSGLTALSVGALAYPTTDSTAGFVVTTNGSGTLSLQAPSGGGGGFTPVVITSNVSATKIAKDEEAINNASGSGVTTVLLPDETGGNTVAIGDEFRVVGGTCVGGWLLSIGAAGQFIHVGNTSTTATGTVASTNQYDQITIVAITASPNASFVAIQSIGALSVL